MSFTLILRLIHKRSYLYFSERNALITSTAYPWFKKTL